MPKIICCLYRQPSDDSEADHLSSRPSEVPHFHGLASSFRGSLDSKISSNSELRQIFATSQDAENRNSIMEAATARADLSESSRPGHLQSNTSRLHTVLRRCFTRDSIWTSRTAWRKTLPTPTEEEPERRRGRKNRLRKRVHDEQLQDQLSRNHGYDSDAEMISTPVLTKQRSFGAIRMSSKQLSGLIRRFGLTPSEASLADTTEETTAFERMPLHLPFENSTSIWDNEHQGTTSPFEDFFGKPDSREDVTTRLNPTGNPVISEPDEKFGGTFPKDSALAKVSPARVSSAPGFRLHDVSKEQPDQHLTPAKLPLASTSILRSWRLSSSRSRGESTIVRGIRHDDDSTEQRRILADPSDPIAQEGRGSDISSTPLLSKHDLHRIVGIGSGLHKPTVEAALGGVDGFVDPRQQSKQLLSIESSQSYGLPRDDGLITDIILPERDVARCLHPAMSLADLTDTASILQAVTKESSLRNMNMSMASSMYSVQSPDCTSSANTSMARLGHIADRTETFRGLDVHLANRTSSQSTIDISNLPAVRVAKSQSEYLRRHTIDMSSSQSKIDDQRGKAPPKAQGTHPEPRGENGPKLSKFKEDFDEFIQKPMIGELNVALEPIYQNAIDGHEDVSLEKPRGHGYSTATRDNETTESMWKRRTQRHAESSRSIARRSLSSMSRYTDQSPVQGMSSLMEIGSTRSLASPRKSRMFEPDTRIPKSWAVWPNHTREQRNSSPPSEVDQVSSYDGASKLDMLPRANTQSMDLGERKVNGRTLGKKLLNRWSRKPPHGSPSSLRYESNLFPFNSPAAKHDCPELAIYPPVPALPPFVAHEKQTDDLDKLNLELQPDEELLKVSSRGAKAWSRIYEDCVARPQELEEAPDPIASDELLRPNTPLVPSPRKAWRSHSRFDLAPPSSLQELRKSSSCPAVRASETISDLEDLKAEEEKAREHLLAAVERAWGA